MSEVRTWSKSARLRAPASRACCSSARRAVYTVSEADDVVDVDSFAADTAARSFLKIWSQRAEYVWEYPQPSCVGLKAMSDECSRSSLPADEDNWSEAWRNRLRLGQRRTASIVLANDVSLLLASPATLTINNVTVARNYF
jgi:hypothetical protein